MAPLPADESIRDLTLSSVELDSRSSRIDLPAYLSTLSLPERELLDKPPSHSISKRTNDLLVPSDPLAAHSQLHARTPAPPPPTYGAGAIPPDAINMKGIQAVFALIGASFVIAGIWFFFWAKNGGFQWRKGDWDDYKSTVLRRKGPDGKTLSNATKSTRLGGGSVVASGYSDEDGMTELSSEAPIIQEKKSKAGKKGAKAGKGLRGGDGRRAGEAVEKKKAQKQRQQKEERWEGGLDDDVRAYRHEKPAKVGGLNADSDAQFYGTDYSATDPTPSSAGAGPRPSAARHSSRQTSPVKPPHHQHRQHPSTRRDFSYDHGSDSSFTAATTTTTTTRYPTSSSPSKTPAAAAATAHRQTTVPATATAASYTEPLDFDAHSHGTKSYHHPIPGLSPAGGFRANRGRGGRRDSLDDSD